MKFIETRNGTLVNVDAISEIYVSSPFGQPMTSWIRLKNRKEYEFLELPKNIKKLDGEIVDTDQYHIDLMHRIATRFIISEEIEDGQSLNEMLSKDEILSKVMRDFPRNLQYPF